MAFQPEVNQELSIDGMTYLVAEHPSARGIPYGQEGRQAVVYQLVAGSEKRAIKAFKSRYQMPSMVGLAKRLAPYATMPGLQVCRRSVLSPQQHDDLLNAYPDLLYAVLMPWIEGPTWMEVMLEKIELTPDQSLTLARALAGILAGMEQEGLAHCDLSGPNLLLPMMASGPTTYQTPVALVDVEQMFGPDLRRPEVVPGGSAGYAHKTAPEGLWSSDADRFAGAVLIAEILAWCDPRVREASWGESYFDPQEMQADGERYRLLVTALTEAWGGTVARMFERAWTSQTLADCPSFGQWLVSLPKSVPGTAGAQAEPEAATPGTSEVSVRTLMELASRFEAQGNLTSALATYQQARSLPDVGSALASELTFIIDELEKQVAPQPTPGATTPPPQPASPAPQAPPRKSREDIFFDQGLSAYNRGEWREAKELLAEVVRVEPNYSRAGQSAASLLAESERRIAAAYQPQPAAPVAPIAPVVQAAQGTQTVPITPADAPAAETARVEAKPPLSTIDRLTRIVVPATLGLLLLIFGGFVIMQLQGTPKPPAAGNGAASSPVPEDANNFLGLIRFHDGSNALDEVSLSTEKSVTFPAPPAGKQYQVWLLGAGGERRRSLGILKLEGDERGKLEMTDEEGTNLLKLYDAFEITLESDPDSSPELPSSEVAFSGALPPEAYMHMRHVLVETEETPEQVGWTLGLLREADLVLTITKEMVKAQESGDVERMRLDAEGLLNLIEGEKGANFGDVNQDSRVTTFGDGFGLLPNGDRLGYIQGLIAHTQNVIRAADSTENIRIHADHTVVAAQNLGEWIGELRTLTLNIAKSTSVEEAGADVRKASALADRILNGHDLNGNEQVEPIEGEGGAKTAYQHAQYMGDMFILRDGAQKPANAGTPAPMPSMEMGVPTP